jgi:pimeloyl-ACP methyl ester carboxylesterase
MAFHNIRLGDSFLTYSDMGQGPTIVFLHGAGGIAHPLQFMERLSGDYRIIAPIHPGFDRTERPERIETVEDVAFLYHDLIESLDLRRVHLVGFSLGGWIAMEMGIQSRDRLASMTLASAPGLLVRDVHVPDNFLWNEEQRIVELLYNKDLGRRIASAPTDEAEDLRRLGNWTMLARLAWSPRWYSPRLEKWHHRLKMPTHVIWGREDGFFPPGYADDYVRRLPNARKTLLGECGHLPYVEQPDSLEQALRSFLAEQTP